jgi:hypothetical protein
MTNSRVSLWPEWVDEVPAHRIIVDPGVVDDAQVRQHNAAVLRVAAIHIPERGSIPASSMVDWLNHLAGQATRQAELWAAAATLLRDVASEFAPDGDAELAPANVMWRLTERADAISHGQLS